MVEVGGKVLTQFLTAGLADELHLVVAPFFVGHSRAQRFVGDGSFPWNPDRHAERRDRHDAIGPANRGRAVHRITTCSLEC